MKNNSDADVPEGVEYRISSSCRSGADSPWSSFIISF